MEFDLDLIFPIKDVTSADLMTLKARCLWNAGVVDDRQQKLVQHRAARFLELSPIAGGNPGDCLNADPQPDLSRVVSSPSAAARR
jgi:hypothetical protein